MAWILGISAYYHDSAAALIKDGEIIAAAQEERFTRLKHDASLPKNAINYCLKFAGINPESLDAVVFYEKPMIKFERILETVLAYSPNSMRFFVDSMPVWLNTKLFIPQKIDKFFEKKLKCPIYFTQHHEAHQASAFYPSPFENSAILCLDGVGEWDTTTWGKGLKNQIQICENMEFPHSLGLLYSTFTGYLGFKVNSGEYKVMGLAPYGEPKYVNLIYDNIVDLKTDGSFRLNQEFFGYCNTNRMYSDKFSKLFGKAPRKSETELTQKDMDIAASIQAVTDEVVLRLAKDVREKSGLNNLCLAGGCALNCVANGKLLKSNLYDNIWIQPASGDAGGALGAALTVYYKIFNGERIISKNEDFQKGSLLGPEYSISEILSVLDKYKADYKIINFQEDTAKLVAEYLAQGKSVGHFSGRMEFGPRALGNRSIFADARNPEMQKKLNLAIKKRESFRPFAPSCLEEDASFYFNLDKDKNSPYMLLTAQIKDEMKIEVQDKDITGLQALGIVRSKIPAVTHVDYSARVQTVKKETNPRYWHIINEFKKLTGYSVIVNTSFNVRGEPIVCSPEDAFKCFMFTNLDVLVLENIILLKENQKEITGFEEYKKTLIKD